jgi:cation diffusion facilitator family transporter
MAANLLLSAAKLVVGWLGSSQALVADAVHSLSDTATDLAILIGVRFWSAPADANHSYGHGRIELLVSVAIGVFLAVAGLGIGYHALASLGRDHTAPRADAVLAVAVASMIVKEALFRATAAAGRSSGSSALIANAWHHRSDALSSLPVVVAVAGTALWPQATYLDHVAAVVVTVFILQAAWRISWPALQKLADAGASVSDRETILAIARGTDGVCDAHRLRTRHLGNGLQVDLHVQVAPDLTVRRGHEIAHAVQGRLLATGPNVVNVLLHVEPFEGDLGPGRTGRT